MKYIYITISLLILNLPLYSQCPNGDAESGNFSLWNRYQGNNFEGSLNLSTFVPSTGNQQSIATPGLDPIVGANLSTVIDGNYSFRLGDNMGNETASILSYTFTVGGGTGATNFSFLYALVLEAPNHPANEQPFFSYWISRSSNLATSTNFSNLIYQKPKIISDATNPFFSTFGSFVYKGWQTECVPALNAFVGQQVTIYFAVADCSPIPHPGAHMAYAYIDGLCKNNAPNAVLTGPTNICNIDDPIVFDGSGTTNETDFYWKIEQTNASGGVIPGISFTTPTIYNAPVTNLSVRTTLTNAGYEIPNNAYFKVSLFAINCNWGATSISKIFHTVFPNLLTSSNVVTCCNSASGLSANVPVSGFQIGYPITNYKWYDESGNYLGNGTASDNYNDGEHSNIIVSPTKSTKYRVEFESNGCKNRKWIYVTKMSYNPQFQETPNFTFSQFGNCTWPKYVAIVPNSSNYYFLNCNNTNNDISDLAFHINAAQASLSYSWNIGSTAQTIPAQANTTYQVTIASPCGNKAFAVTPRNFTGSFPTLFVPSACSETQPLPIYNTLLAINAIPAYNASRFRFRIYNNWGQMVYEQNEFTQTGFYNGQMKWDGKANGVYPAQTTVFNYSIELWNCSSVAYPSANVVKTGNITFVR
jgi:hypothetical protein